MKLPEIFVFGEGGGIAFGNCGCLVSSRFAERGCHGGSFHGFR